MKLDYGTQISYSPISLSAGTIKKPLLKDIAAVGFDTFIFYEFLAKLTPEIYYKEMADEKGKQYWDSLNQDEQNEVKIFDCVKKDEKLQKLYEEVFKLFFVESVVYFDGFYIVLKNGVEFSLDLTQEDVKGVIIDEFFENVLDILQQIMGIKSDKDEEKPKFKNEIARKLYERMKKAEEQKNKSKGVDLNFSIPNIISAVASRHNSLNYTNIWELTLYQLFDVFNRLQNNGVYELDATRVSVWGDEKKTFNPSLWYKNDYDKRSAK